jgi:hypothetical protein
LIVGHIRIFFLKLKIKNITHNNNNNLQQLEHPKKILVKFNHYRLWAYQNFEKTPKKSIKLYATRHRTTEPNGLKHLEHPKKNA